MKLLHLTVVVILSFSTIGVVASEPVGWRTDGTGRYPDANPPTMWSATEKIVWKTPMPSWSNATPVVVGDRIFTCAEPDRLICLSRDDGRILWVRSNSYHEVLGPEEAQKIQEAGKKANLIRPKIHELEKRLRELAEGLNELSDKTAEKRQREIEEKLKPLREELQSLNQYEPPRPPQKMCGYSSSTPASDGKYVCMVFGTGVVSCYDLDGNLKWARFLEKPGSGHGHSASPLIAGDKLLVHIKNLIALELASGRELWRVESGSRFGSLVKADIDDVSVVITANGDIVRIADGKKLASNVLGLGFNTAVVQDGVAYFIQHGGKAVRVKNPANPSGQAELEVLWQTNPVKGSYLASPVVHNGLIYAITEWSVFSVIDAGNGLVIYRKKLDLGGERCFPSITLAGEYLFVSIDNGRTLILKPGPEYEEFAENAIEAFRSSPVFVGDRLYIRGLQHMYCIGP